MLFPFKFPPLIHTYSTIPHSKSYSQITGFLHKAAHTNLPVFSDASCLYDQIPHLFTACWRQFLKLQINAWIWRQYHTRFSYSTWWIPMGLSSWTHYMAWQAGGQYHRKTAKLFATVILKFIALYFATTIWNIYVSEG